MGERMSSKRWISFPKAEGEHSRQAHADLPAGTFEREMGKEGFFGPELPFPSSACAHRLVQLRRRAEAARLRPQRDAERSGRALGERLHS